MELGDRKNRLQIHSTSRMPESALEPKRLCKGSKMPQLDPLDCAAGGAGSMGATEAVSSGVAVLPRFLPLRVLAPGAPLVRALEETAARRAAVIEFA
jgi:hypothetical protein